MTLTKEEVESYRPEYPDLCDSWLTMLKMLEESLKSLERTYSYGAHYQIRIKSRIDKLKELLG